MKLSKLITTTLLSSVLSVSLMAGGQMIVNSSVSDALSADDIKAIYLGKKTQLVDGQAAKPAYPDTIDAVGTAFFTDVVKKSHKKFKKYWVKRVFAGNGVPPKSLSNDGDVIKYVTNNPGGIGFVSEGTSLPNGVKTIPITW